MKTFILIALTTFYLQANGQNQSNKNTMEEFILLLKYVKRPYSLEENEQIKQLWATKMANWNGRGIYVSSQVLTPDIEKTLLPDGSVIDKIVAEGEYFIGATVTIKATGYNEACSIAKEAPHLAMGGQVEVRQLRHTQTEACIYLIDTFTVPETSKEAFLARIAVNRDFIKTLPGFIQDNAYEQKNTDGSFSYITIACWKDTASVENAKKEVSSLYKKQDLICLLSLEKKE